MPNETTDWPAAWAALAVMDGDEWDAEIDRLNALWKAEYVNAFVAFAVSRKWVYGNAETWASEIADEASVKTPAWISRSMCRWFVPRPPGALASSSFRVKSWSRWE